MARVALVLALIFSTAFMLGVCTVVPFLETYPNPVVVGRPFKLVAQSDNDTVERECSVKIYPAALSIYNIGEGKQESFSFKAKENKMQGQTWDAVAFTCPKDLKDFKATLTCIPTTTTLTSTTTTTSLAPSGSAPRVPTTMVSADIGVELEGNLSLHLQTTRNLNSDDFVLTLSVQSSFLAAPLRDVHCSFTYTIASGLIPKTGGPCANTTSTTMAKGFSCPLKDVLHPGVQPLEVVWDGSKVQAGATISVTCDAKLGPISCPSLASAKIDIPPPRLRIGLSKSEVVAGENVTLTATLGGDAGKDCTLELPDGTFHLTKAKEGADCTQVNKTNTYVCKTKDHTTAAYEIHVDSSADAATGDKRKAVKLQCGDTHTEELVAVTVHSELDKPVLKLFRVGTQSFKVSARVINKGPSDAVVGCTLKYPDLFGNVDQVKCAPDIYSEGNTTACPLFKGIAVAGKNGEGKVPDFEKNFTMPHVKFDGFPTFNLSCTPRGGEEKFVELVINYGNVTKTGTDVLKPDDKTVKQPDSYFWTYTIVIINLFLIALVVFVGMWWRNRAIARSMAGAERVDRFNEMEMFSSDHRPLSKAE